MNYKLNLIKTEIYDKCGLQLSDFKMEDDGKDYSACGFKLNGLKILSRNAKVTPKKVGQFVMFWRRDQNGIIEPFNETDQFDFYIVTVKTENHFGQFIFPKSILIKKGIISTAIKRGKNGFIVYPVWDKMKNKRAEKSQKWQLNYFYEIGETIDFNKVTELYNAH